MPSFHNIEKLPGKQYHTGYAGGAVYRIYRVDGCWRAHYTGDDRPLNTPLWFYRRTLREVSELLDQIAEARKPLKANA